MIKNNVIIFISVLLLSSILLNCSSEDNSFPPRIYSLKIRIQDKSGNDKIKGIGYIKDDKAERQIYEVQRNLYNLDVKQTGKHNEDLFLSPLYVQQSDLYDCFIITTNTLPLPDYRPSQLEHKLVCSYTFGDNKDHVIVSTWERKSPVLDVCTSISIDGVTYSISDVDKDGNSVFTVIID